MWRLELTQTLKKKIKKYINKEIKKHENILKQGMDMIFSVNIIKI